MSDDTSKLLNACVEYREMVDKLERENTALRERLDSVQKSHFTLSKDNAALRTLLKRWLKVADDCHQEQQQVGYSEYNITVGLVCDTRALLDAARKEAQP